jgi:hypothetical protein
MMKPLNAFHLIAVTGLLLAASSCDDSENYLKGSLVDEYGIDFDDIRIRLYESELAVEYLSGGQGGKVTLRVTVENTGLAQGKTYDLKTQGTVTRPDFETELPDLESGSLALDAFSPQDGAAVSGTFKAIFATAEQNRLSLRGGFKGDLEKVHAEGVP